MLVGCGRGPFFFFLKSGLSRSEWSWVVLDNPMDPSCDQGLMYHELPWHGLYRIGGNMHAEDRCVRIWVALCRLELTFFFQSSV